MGENAYFCGVQTVSPLQIGVPSPHSPAGTPVKLFSLTWYVRLTLALC